MKHNNLLRFQSEAYDRVFVKLLMEDIFSAEISQNKGVLQYTHVIQKKPEMDFINSE